MTLIGLGASHNFFNRFQAVFRKSMPVKPYFAYPIQESHEPLVPIPADQFVCASPHPYAALGAPYGDTSPFYVRQGVLDGLRAAQKLLRQRHAELGLFIFDAYRPVAVQRFMVNYTFEQALRDRGQTRSQLTAAEETALWESVYQLWAPPHLEPDQPPPHSTGGAVDVSLYHLHQQVEVWMGSPIDELSARSQPNYFAGLAVDPQRSPAERAAAAQAQQHRTLLAEVMTAVGFRRHPGEWWHFCLGDQMWAWLCHQTHPHQTWTARYGRADSVIASNMG